MSKILGLDLGTNSIGWAVIEKDSDQLSFYEDNGHPTKGVIVFPEGVKIEDKTGSIKSRAGERTDYRGARRLKFRRKLRKHETLLMLAKNKMCPLTVDEVIAWRKSNFKNYPDKQEFLDWLRTDNLGDKVNRRKQMNNPCFFRDKFSREKYNWEDNQELKYELGRAFYHMAQRRGFKSNRLEQSDENIISDVKEQVQELLIESANSAELYQNINEIYEEHEFEDKTNDDLDATQQKIRRILNYIFKVLSNKDREKDFSDFAKAKEEIDRYINKPENLGPVKGGIKELSQKIEDANCDTLGQYFWHLYQKDRHHSDNKIRTNYTAREEHYLEEFNQICRVQVINSVDEKYSLKEPAKRFSGLALALYKAIFFQRPLKSQKGLVGKCTFESAKPRCPVSRPEFEEFRMWSFINNIKIKTPDDEQLRPLTKEEKDKIIPKFYRQKSSFKFQELVEALFGKDAVKNGDAAYYKDRQKTKTATYLINYKFNANVSGNPVSAAFKNIFGADWKIKTYTYTSTNAKDETVKCTADYKDIWHVLFTFQDESNLKEFAEKKLGLTPAEARKFSKPLPQGYANLSLKAINKILLWLEKGLIYPHAVFMANIGNVVDKDIWKNNQEEIEKGIGEIIESHDDEKKKINAVNNRISDSRANRSQCSKEAESIYKKELEEELKAQFGKTTWSEKPEEVKNEIRKEAFKLFLKQLKANELKGGEFAKVKRLDERVKEFLMGNNPDGVVYCSSEEQIEENLYHPSDLERFKPVKVLIKDGKIVKKDKGAKEMHLLPLPNTDAIKNPTLMRAMHQLRKLLNELLMEGIIDNRTAIHIEMAREINDPNKRKAIEKWQEKLRDENIEISQIISELFKEQNKKNKVENNDIKKVRLWTEQLKDEKNKDIDIFELSNKKKTLIEKYKLWKEQKGICVYTGKSISLSQLFDGNSVDVEHTLPKSRSWDDSMMNKTIADKKYQSQVKLNKTPFELGEEKHEEILQRIRHWKVRYEELDDQIKNMKPSRIQDENKRNEKTQEKHLKTFERDYWKGKYERFTTKEITEGFKNSQKVDTGLITRFAREFLGCLFKNKNENSNVFTVDGSMVDQFRRAWGVHKSITDENGIEKKDRSNHIHHLVDAVTIACMTRDRYDLMAAAWKREDEGNKREARRIIEQSKPWDSFTDDVRNKLEEHTLIVHIRKDNVPKQSKKKLRKRGKIVHNNAIYERDSNGKILKDENNKLIVKDYIYALDENGNKIPVKGKRLSVEEIKDKKEGKDYFSAKNSKGETYYYEYVWKKDEIVYRKADKPIYQQGDTARGSLHQETFYGAIKQPEIDDKTGKPKQTKSGAFILKKNKKGEDEIIYVVRKELKKLKASDIENIIDDVVRNKIIEAKRNNEIKFNKNGATVKDKIKIWMNKEKGVEIKKVRIKAHLAEPLSDFKEQRDIKKNPDGSEKHPHKKWIYVQNAENHGMALYEEGKHEKVSVYNVAQMISIGERNSFYPNNIKINKGKKNKKLLYIQKRNGKEVIVKNGSMVILYEDHENPKNIVTDLCDENIQPRLYTVIGIDERIKMRKHNEARPDKILREDLKNKLGNAYEDTMVTGRSYYLFNESPIKINIRPSKINALIEGVDFEITPTGKIQPIKKKENQNYNQSKEELSELNEMTSNKTPVKEKQPEK